MLWEGVLTPGGEEGGGKTWSGSAGRREVSAAQETGGGFGRACALCSLSSSAFLTLLLRYLPQEGFLWSRLASLQRGFRC